ncbi:MAG: hypothetical protein P4M10_00020 [Verrucomicrobiae bacterium]|nr:hypothetical protein [Verrucomicrobiae bacterium]
MENQTKDSIVPPDASAPGTPPSLSAGAPPVMAGPPPPIPSPVAAGHKFAVLLLSLFLGLFVVTALISLADDTCVVLFSAHPLTGLDGLLTLGVCLLALLVYALMGLTPVIPKRVVLPLLGIMLLSFLTAWPMAIFYYRWLLQYDLAMSCLMAVTGLAVLHRLHGGWRIRWPLVPEKCLGQRAFSWLNLSVFLAVNVLVLPPLAAAYTAGCAGLALNHFTDGFMTLHPAGVVAQARQYVREDGKTVVLFPMSHIAEAEFYRSVAQVVDSNSVVLLEGVTDEHHLMTNHLTYQRAARSLHLAEQHDDFQLKLGKLVRADVDIQEFSSNTIALLNLAALVHSEGLNPHTLSLLLACNPTEEMEWQVLDDVLLKRNQHVLKVLNERLPGTDKVVIPWGAVHMAGLSEAIQKAGFHLVATRDYVSIRFGKKKDGQESGGWVPLPADRK